MFVIDNLRNAFERKQSAWERRCQKWIDEGADRHGYNYRDRNDYERKEPSPKRILNNWLKIGGNVLLFAVIGALVTLFVMNVEVTTESDACDKFDKGQKVSIQNGDYKGNTGEVVECGEDYQVKLGDKQNASIKQEDGSFKATDVSGQTITVKNADNLVKVETPKE